jgi:hypothetical protein
MHMTNKGDMIAATGTGEAANPKGIVNIRGEGRYGLNLLGWLISMVQSGHVREKAMSEMEVV